jgi:hypothetical protein
MIVSIEYDDGIPTKQRKKRESQCSENATPRDRVEGFYVRYPNGVERRLPIGYMRVSEMLALEKVFNELVVNLGAQSNGETIIKYEDYNLGGYNE